MKMTDGNGRSKTSDKTVDTLFLHIRSMGSIIYLAAGEPDALIYPAGGEPESLIQPAAGVPDCFIYRANGGPSGAYSDPNGRTQRQDATVQIVTNVFKNGELARRL